MSDSVERMMKNVTGLCTPLQDVILRESVTDRQYANLAAAELETLRAQLHEAVEALKFITDFGNYATDSDVETSDGVIHVSEYAAKVLKQVTPA